MIRNVSADSQIRVNEFLIDPLPQRVELINIGSSSADISGWYIDDTGGNSFFTIPQIPPLSPNSCSVFEADFNFNKTTSDSIRLFDGTAQPTSISANLIDSFSYRASSGSGITFKRIPDGSGAWATGEADFGFFNKTVNSCITSPMISPTPTLTPTATPSPTSILAEKINNIYISEVMINPETGEKEWVELYNDNEFSVELVDWFIDDNEEGSTPKSLSLSLPSKGLTVFELESSIFNNSGDMVRLLNEEEFEKDTFSYTSSEKGKGWGRDSLPNGAFCLQESTKGLPNGHCISVENKTTSSGSKKAAPAPTKVASALIKTSIKSAHNFSKNRPSPTKLKTTNEKNSIANHEEVLGEQTYIAPETPRSRLPKNLSFISIAYSILTMASIFLKIKLALG